MTADLFPDLPEVLSPRLVFLAKHGLETERIRSGDPDDLTESPETGDDIPVWVCRTKAPRLNGLFCANEIGGGDTEVEAIVDFCINSGVPYWTVEAAVTEFLTILAGDCREQLRTLPAEPAALAGTDPARCPGGHAFVFPDLT